MKDDEMSPFPTGFETKVVSVMTEPVVAQSVKLTYNGRRELGQGMCNRQVFSLQVVNRGVPPSVSRQ